ncbi:MAG: FAD-binding protein [Coriobacteriaceae bacterium]
MHPRALRARPPSSTLWWKRADREGRHLKRSPTPSASTRDLLATVEQHTGYDAQNDTQYAGARRRRFARRPFYACKLSGMAPATLDGIKINTKFQALDENNAPIEGLYVIATTRAITTTAPTRTRLPA